MKIYDRIEGLCREKEDRTTWITKLLDELRLSYVVDEWIDRGRLRKNVIVPGTGRFSVVAHHDIVNPASDNANDNSASVINAIALKRIRPEITVVLTDGEEVGGLGASRFAEQCKVGRWQVDCALNLELTGIGGASFFIGEEGSGSFLGQHIDKVFAPEHHHVPFNDSVILRRHGIDSVVINPLPRVDGKFDWSPLSRCHTTSDSLDLIRVEDMREFTEGVLEPLAARWRTGE
jgi:hypothetical protein